MGKNKRKQSKKSKGKQQKNNKNKKQHFQTKTRKGRTKTMSNWNKYFGTFYEWLKPKGIYMRDVDGDGNCLFRSMF